MLRFGFELAPRTCGLLVPHGTELLHVDRVGMS